MQNNSDFNQSFPDGMKNGSPEEQVQPLHDALTRLFTAEPLPDRLRTTTFLDLADSTRPPAPSAPQSGRGPKRMEFEEMTVTKMPYRSREPQRSPWFVGGVVLLLLCLIAAAGRWYTTHSNAAFPKTPLSTFIAVINIHSGNLAMSNGVVQPPAASIFMAFSKNDRGASYQIQPTDSVSCGGTMLTNEQGAFVGQLAVGTTIKCTFFIAETTTSLTLSLPSLPDVTFPQPGATLSLTQNALIRWRPASPRAQAVDITADNVQSSLGSQPAAKDSGAISDSGSYLLNPVHVPYKDFTAIEPGPGYITLGCIYPDKQGRQGTLFQNVIIDTSASIYINVTWQ